MSLLALLEATVHAAVLDLRSRVCLALLDLSLGFDTQTLLYSLETPFDELEEK